MKKWLHHNHGWIGLFTEKKKKISTKFLLNFWYSDFQAEKLTIVSQSEVQKSAELHRGMLPEALSAAVLVLEWIDTLRLPKVELNSFLY